MRTRNLKELIELAKMSGLLYRTDVLSTLMALARGWDDNVAESLERFLTAHAMPFLTGLPFVRSSLPGSIKLGMTPWGWAGVDQKDINQGVLIIGRSGSGKTNLILFLLAQLMEQQIPWSSFDLKKDYRSMSAEFDLRLIPWEQLKYNPFEPPAGVSLGRWLQVSADLFSHSYSLLTGSRNFLYTQLTCLAAEPTVPNLVDLDGRLRLHTKPGSAKGAWYLETVRNRVRACAAAAGSVFDCQKGFPANSLASHPTVIELDGLGEDLQSYLVEAMLGSLFHFRMGLNQRGGLRHVAVFDEAKRVFSRTKELSAEAGIPTIDTITSQAREFGEALIVADQEASKLTDSILANSMVKVLMSVGSGKDLRIMADAMGLTKEQEKFALGLGVGEAIVKVAGHEPVPIRIPQVIMEKTIDEESVRQNVERTAAQYSWTPRPEGSPQSPETTKITEDEMQLLKSVAMEPFLGTIDRTRKLGMTNWSGGAKVSRLRSSGLVVPIRIKSRPRGAKLTLLELTPAGQELAGVPTLYSGKGGLEHRYWQHRLKAHLSTMGAKAIVEYAVPNGFVDVAAFWPDGRSTAVEIELSTRHTTENLSKAIEGGFREIVFLSRDRKGARAIREEVGAGSGSSVPISVCSGVMTEFCSSDDHSTCPPYSPGLEIEHGEK